jgi:hypothetical protein
MRRGAGLVDNRPADWIPPVSDREHQEVSEYERQYEDGSDPRILDIIDIPLLEHRPNGYQQENWLLDPDSYWEKVGNYRWTDLAAFSETKGTLWRNGCHTYNGEHDQIPLDEAAMEISSLKLIRVDAVRLKVFSPGIAFSNPKRRVQAQFRFSRTNYSLWVTDPDVERTYLARPNSQYDLAGCYLTISLGEPFKDHCYKLVAAIIKRTRWRAQ